MTRFARAKGSKSSNEKKPEEATTWSEMRNSMLSKKLIKQEEKSTQVKEPVKIETLKKSEWASLGDTLNDSISLIKKHMGKNNNLEEIKYKKKNKANVDLTPAVNNISKVKNKKNKKVKSVPPETVNSGAKKKENDDVSVTPAQSGKLKTGKKKKKSNNKNFPSKISNFEVKNNANENANLMQTQSDTSKIVKKKKKKMKNFPPEVANSKGQKSDTVDANTTPMQSDTPKIGKKKKEKQKNFLGDNEGSEISAKKKGKKRKFIEGDVNSETVLPKKKKKLIKLDNEECAQENNMQGQREKDENVEKGRNNQNKRNKKKGVKSKECKKENDFKKGFKPSQGKQFEGKKKFKNKKFKEKSSSVEELIINGEKIPIMKFQGFFVTVEDAERLKKLRDEMKKEGIPRAKIEAAIKLERRRAEKALSRLKKSVCFHCRGHGHLLSSCPELMEKENTGTGICYKCGSTEHLAVECKVVRGTNYQFAECFICKEQGHIARQCPDNPRGLYPQGGACRECGDVTHLRKDCPKVQAQRAEEVVTVGVRRDRDLECLDEEIANREQQSAKKVKKSSTVKF